jgi:hypothetical protein
MKEVNTKSDGTKLTEKEVLESNLLACIDSYGIAHSDEDLLILCSRQKIDNNDYKYCMACMPVNKYNDKLVNITLFKADNVPTIVIDDKRDILDTVRRVLKNKAFI